MMHLALTPPEVAVVLLLLLVVLLVAVLNVLYYILKTQRKFLKVYLVINHEEAQLSDFTDPNTVTSASKGHTQPQGFLEMLKAEELANNQILRNVEATHNNRQSKR